MLVFCDASTKAYAASVYLRIKEETGIKTRLVPVNRGKNNYPTIGITCRSHRHKGCKFCYKRVKYFGLIHNACCIG